MGDRSSGENALQMPPLKLLSYPGSLANSVVSEFGDSTLPAAGAGWEMTLQNKNNNDRKPPVCRDWQVLYTILLAQKKREPGVGGESVPTVGPSGGGQGYEKPSEKNTRVPCVGSSPHLAEGSKV